MIHTEEEMTEFVPFAGAVTMAANQHQTPWVFDPVAHFISAVRRDATQALLGRCPTVIRGNASEIMALAAEAAPG